MLSPLLLPKTKRMDCTVTKVDVNAFGGWLWWTAGGVKRHLPCQRILCLPLNFEPETRILMGKIIIGVYNLIFLKCKN